MTAAAPALVHVNDRPQPWAPGSTLLGVLAGLGLSERRGIAVARNGAVVPRADWAARPVEAGDRIVVIQATQGG